MTDQPKLIFLTAGGTGGHVYPADALANELAKRGFDLHLVTDKRGLNNYHGKLGEIANHAVFSGGWVGKSKIYKLLSLLKLSIGILQSMYLLLRYRPLAVVGFGGYASFPCAMAAVLLHKPLIIHEQNSVMSRTNRFLAKYASFIATSFAQTKYVPSQSRQSRTGMPIRQSISSLYNQNYSPIDNSDKFNLLVLGGSQGAKIFGQIIPEAIRLLPPSIQSRLFITQQCCRDDIAKLQTEYATTACKVNIASFFDDMPSLYGKGQLIISRAGASSVSEIAAAGLPSILVPLPTAADNHQSFNAREFAEWQSGLVIEQKDFTAEKLAEILQNLLNNPQELVKMSLNTRQFAIIDADVRLADCIENILK